VNRSGRGRALSGWLARNPVELTGDFCFLLGGSWYKSNRNIESQLISLGIIGFSGYLGRLGE
jgi:hypothetical protein